MFARANVKLKSWDLENRFYDNSRRNRALARKFKYRRPLTSNNLEYPLDSIIHINMIYLKIKIVKFSQRYICFSYVSHIRCERDIK